jgi:predicted transposase YbfD/YdcC
LVLGQLATEEKGNEITSTPKLLDLLELTGCIVTIDAMGTQTKIAGKIISKGANYILPVKENQPKLLEDIVLYFGTGNTDGFDRAETDEVGHGRIEKRTLAISKDIAWLDSEGRWKNLSGIGMLNTRTETISTGKIESATQYLIFSDPSASAEQILRSKRAHWGIGNSLHWVLDVAFNEDNCRVRVDNAAFVFNILRHLILSLLMREKSSKGGARSKQLRCALSTQYMERVLGIS